MAIFNMGKSMAIELTPNDKATYLRYAALSLPRHTSYPASSFWKDGWSAASFERQLADLNGPLSLYVHVPFCASLCYYCGCTREIVGPESRTRNDPSESYLAAIKAELFRLRAITGPRTLAGIHLGGGTPTFLRPAQIETLQKLITDAFDIAPNAELAAEIDPRSLSEEHLPVLRRLGFNRLSLGVQDFDPRVQAAVNRVQPFELVKNVVDDARSIGFRSINFDLIYGLPWQTPASMARTLDQVVELSPDRVAFYRLAVIPELFRWQRAFTHADLPDGEASLALMLQAMARFAAANYEFIGLDHFAKASDPLVSALNRGELGRSFQGMTAGRSQATLGIGPSAISSFPGGFAQNERQYAKWRLAVTDGRLATVRGFDLAPDDVVRGDVIQDTYATGRISLACFEQRHGVTFDRYFSAEMSSLRSLEEEGLVVWGKNDLALTPVLGRLLARVVASVFDRYLPQAAWRTGLAKGGSKVG